MTDRTRWPLRRCQSRALCALTEKWQTGDDLYPVRHDTLYALKHRGLVEDDWGLWRLTEFGVREARRYGSVAAVNKGS